MITAKRGGPSRDWLNPDLEYVATQRAKSRIRGWLRKQERGGENILPADARPWKKSWYSMSADMSFETVSRLFVRS